MVKKDGQTPMRVWRFPRISLASRVDGVRALKPESQNLPQTQTAKNYPVCLSSESLPFIFITPL